MTPALRQILQVIIRLSSPEAAVRYLIRLEGGELNLQEYQYDNEGSLVVVGEEIRYKSKDGRLHDLPFQYTRFLLTDFGFDLP